MQETIEVKVPWHLDIEHAVTCITDALDFHGHVTEDEFNFVRDVLAQVKTVMDAPPAVPEKMGWGLFYTGMQDSVHNLYEIQRIDSECIFHDDQDAIRFVVMMAIALDGKGIEADVIRWLMRRSPNEVDNIIRNAVPEAAFSKLMEVCK